MNRIDFGSRSKASELMDTEEVDFEELRACLVDLARVNRWTFGYRPTLDFLEELVRRRTPSKEPLRILDVGSGYGDTLREIASWAVRRGIAASLTGLDINPWARRAAEEATHPTLDISWIGCDVFEYDPNDGVDVIVSSLFTHHLSDPSMARFLSWMEATARRGWFVNDLHRHPLPYYAFMVASKLARLHRFVQHDGPVSIARAFDERDWRRLLADAGLGHTPVALTRYAPFRLCVGRFREPA